MKRLFILLLTVVFIISMLSISIGCKEETAVAEEVTEETVEEAPDEEALEEEPVEKPTLTFWMNTSNPEPYTNLFDRFQEDTGYKLDIIAIPTPFEETTLTKWAAGERPDIIEFHIMPMWFSQLNPEENMIDLSDMEFATKTKFGMLESSFSNGRVWGPVISPPAMWGWLYNKEIFEANSLEIPGNYDELFELCATLKGLGITPLYAAGQDAWPLQIDPVTFFIDGHKNDPNWWDDINSGKTNFVQPAIIDGLEAVQKLIDADYYQENFLVGTYEGMQSAIFDGEVAMVAHADWLITQLVSVYGEEEVNKKIGAFGLSLNSNAVGWSKSSPGATYAIPKTGDTVKEAAAKEFIKYITGEGYQAFLDEIKTPSAIEGFEDPVSTIEPYNELKAYLEKDSSAVWQQNLLVSYGAFEILLQEMFAGTKTPEDIAQSLSDEFVKNAQAAGLEGF